MNLIASLASSNDFGVAARSAPVGAGSNRTAQADAIQPRSWIDLLLQPDDPQQQRSEELAAPVGPEIAASSGQIADALLRSMLGNKAPVVAPASMTLSKVAGIGKKMSEATPKRLASEAGQDSGMQLPIQMAVPAAVLEPASIGTLAALAKNLVAISPAATSPVATTPAATTRDATSQLPTSPDGLSAQVQAGVPSSPTELAFEARLRPKVTDSPVATTPAATTLDATSPLPSSPDALSAQVQAGVPNSPTELAFEARLRPKVDDKVTDADAPAPLVSGAPLLKHFSDRGEAETSAAGDGPEPGGSPENSIAALASGVAVASRYSAPPASTAPEPATGTPRTPEPAHAEPARPTGGAHVHELTVRIAAPGGLPVDVQVNQRPGEMRVVVRTADSGMRLSLRQDLPQLVSTLDRAGFDAETFTARQTADSLLAPGVASSGETMARNSPQDLWRALPQDTSRDTSRESGGKDSSFSSGGREQQQQQQRQREHMHRSWLNQMQE